MEAQEIFLLIFRTGHMTVLPRMIPAISMLMLGQTTLGKRIKIHFFIFTIEYIRLFKMLFLTTLGYF